MLRAGLLAGLFTTYTGADRHDRQLQRTLHHQRRYDAGTIAHLRATSDSRLCCSVPCTYRRAEYLQPSAFWWHHGLLHQPAHIALIAVGSLFDISNMFVNVTPELIDILTTGRGVVAGSLFLIGAAHCTGHHRCGGESTALARLRKVYLGRRHLGHRHRSSGRTVSYRFIRPFLGTERHPRLVRPRRPTPHTCSDHLFGPSVCPIY